MNDTYFFILLMLLLNKKNQNIKININFNIKDEKNNPIKNANIIITSFESSNSIITKTCYNGFAILCCVPQNLYKITVCKEGYTKNTFILNACDICQNLNLNVYLKQLVPTRLYGYITDNLNNEAIDNAVVVLYKVIDKNLYKPMRFTYTDFTGEYNFFNIPNGTYIIKAIK